MDSEEGKHKALQIEEIKIEPYMEIHENENSYTNTIKVEIKPEVSSILDVSTGNKQLKQTTSAAKPFSSDSDMHDLQNQQEPEPVTCEVCNKTFKYLSYLKQHMRCVHTSKDDEVECTLCLRTFKNNTALNTHIRSVHKESDKVKCQQCNKEFLNKKKLLNHMYHTHPEEDTCSCTVCKKTFICKRRLKVHMRLVHPDEGQLVPCPHCNKKVKALLKHIQYSHTPDKMVYKCLECQKIFQTTVSLQRHIANVHSSEEVKCNLCEKLFSSKKNLRRHLSSCHHEKILKPPLYSNGDIQCPQCSKKLISMNTLLWHCFKYHSSMNNNICTMCQKDYKTEPNYKRHLLSVHSLTPGTCNICEKTFKSSIHLRTHVRIAHAPPEAEVNCEICQKTFKCKLHLRMHVTAVHTTDGPFHCDVCQKEFSSKKYMLKHLKSHRTERESRCDVCGKMFKTKSDVRKHIKRVHKDLPSNHDEATADSATSIFEDEEQNQEESLQTEEEIKIEPN